jgi:hypothetical protein
MRGLKVIDDTKVVIEDDIKVFTAFLNLITPI